MRRKEERSKQGQTNNKAKQHSTPKAVTFPCTSIIISLLLDYRLYIMKELSSSGVYVEYRLYIMKELSSSGVYVEYRSHHCAFCSPPHRCREPE